MASDLLDLLDLPPRSGEPQPPLLEFEDDPLQGIPLILLLMCGCASVRRDDASLFDDIAIVVRKDRKEVGAIFADQNANRVGLVDDLRFAAVRDGSGPIHELADRSLISFIGDRPHLPLVERLVQRLRPFLTQTSRRGPMTPHRRANDIAAARLVLMVALAGGDLESRLGRFWTPTSIGWTAQKLVRLAEVAQGDLDDEIALTLFERQKAEGASRKGTDDDLGIAVASEPDEDEDDDEGGKSETETRADIQTETLVVLQRLPLATGADATKLLGPFKNLVARPLPLVPTPDLAAVRRTLVAELPHLAPVIDAVLMPIASFASVRIQPTLFVGPPGCGKTTLAERLLQLLGVPATSYDAAGTADAMILGSSRKWGNAAPGLMLDLIVQHEVANPGIIVDEIEKAGGNTKNGDLRTALLGLVEPRRARAYLDRFLEVPVDYSGVIWLATANEMNGIPGPLANRLRVLKCPAPRKEHLNALAPQLMKSALPARGMNERWYQPLTQEEMEALRRHWRGGSIRNLRRMIEGVLSARQSGEALN